MLLAGLVTFFRDESWNAFGPRDITVPIRTSSFSRVPSASFLSKTLYQIEQEGQLLAYARSMLRTFLK